MTEYSVLVAISEDEAQASKLSNTILGLPGDAADIEAVVVNVLEPFSGTDEGGMVTTDDFAEEAVVPTSVRTVATKLESAGVTVSIRREHGTPAEEIVAVAAEIDADSIVVSGHRRSPTGKALFGSTLQSVLLQADRPVITVPAE